MPGTVIRAVPKQNLGFSTTTVTLAKGVDISQYREATLVVRTHGGTNVPAGDTFVVTVYQDAPTSEDPATDFIGPQVPVATNVTINPTSTSSVTMMSIGSNNLPAAIRITGAWTGTTASAAIVISIDVVAKS